MTEFNGKKGYVARGTVRDITPFAPELNNDFSSGGYIDTTSASVKLMSGIHKYSEVLAEIPAKTQVNYYVDPVDANWSIVNYDNNIGYVESKFIKELEDSDFGEDNSDSFAGMWVHDRCSINIQKTGNASPTFSHSVFDVITFFQSFMKFHYHCMVMVMSLDLFFEVCLVSGL